MRGDGGVVSGVAANPANAESGSLAGVALVNQVAVAAVLLAVGVGPGVSAGGQGGRDDKGGLHRDGDSSNVKLKANVCVMRRKEEERGTENKKLWVLVIQTKMRVDGFVNERGEEVRGPYTRLFTQFNHNHPPPPRLCKPCAHRQTENDTTVGARFSA